MQNVRASTAALLALAMGCGSGTEPLACGEAPSCETTCGTEGTRDRRPGSCELAGCTPPSESCNGGDDDCDGRADEGFDCARAALDTCGTRCGSVGTRTCGALCGWGECVAPPEICANEIDDDCDGTVDGPAHVTDHLFATAAQPVALEITDGGLISAQLQARSFTGIARLDPDGTLGASLVEPVAEYDLVRPLLRASGEHVAMAWHQARTLRLSISGPAGAPSALSFSPGAFFGSDVAMAWSSDVLSIVHVRGLDQIVGQRVTREGAMLGPEVPIASSVGSGLSLAIGARGRHLVVWCNGPIRTVLLGPDLQVLGDTPLTHPAGSRYAERPDVASDGSGFLVAWTEGEAYGPWDEPVERQLFAAHIDADGVAGPALRIATAPRAISTVGVTWTGGAYWIAWNEAQTSERDGRLRAARVASDGALTGEVVEIALHVGGSILPDLAWHDGRLHALWSGAHGESHLSVVACD